MTPEGRQRLLIGFTGHHEPQGPFGVQVNVDRPVVALKGISWRRLLLS